ncbi:MAG: hypothetical protein ACHQ1E_14220 [Ktedonobacterales bacterium]
MHAVLSFPELGQVSPLEVWTGVVALLALTALVVSGAGSWFHPRLRRSHLAPTQRD